MSYNSFLMGSIKSFDITVKVTKTVILINTNHIITLFSFLFYEQFEIRKRSKIDHQVSFFHFVVLRYGKNHGHVIDKSLVLELLSQSADHCDFAED